MPLFGLIGNPLGHTFSKKYFSEKFSDEKFAAYQYENFEIKNISELENIIASNQDLLGINVTIPYKQQVLQYLNKQSDLVKKCKACNCIKVVNGELYGFTTDVAGFVNSFQKLLTPTDTDELVLGSGGASKAICVGLQQLGISYKLVSRQSAPETFTYSELDKTNVSEYSIIINTTPVGGGTLKDSAPEFPYQFLTSSHYLFDVVYNPSKTLFLTYGENAGARIMNGEEMLVIQAEERWKIWNNKDQIG